MVIQELDSGDPELGRKQVMVVVVEVVPKSVLDVPEFEVSISLQLAIRDEEGDREDPTPLCSLPPLPPD